MQSLEIVEPNKSVVVKQEAGGGGEKTRSRHRNCSFLLTATGVPRDERRVGAISLETPAVNLFPCSVCIDLGLLIWICLNNNNNNNDVNMLPMRLTRIIIE